MPFTHIACGSPVNQSEERAIQRVKALLQGNTAEHWIGLTNFALLVTHQRQPDDLDIVCVGPRGVILMEVKHWDGSRFASPGRNATDQALKLKSKAERLGGLIRQNLGNIQVRVEQWFVLTREPVGPLQSEFAGAKLFTMNGLKKGLTDFNGGRLSPTEVDAIRHILEPRSRIQTDGKIRRLADFEDLELISPKTQRFHRIYRGVHRRTREKVIAHLYDLSASEEKEPLRIAEREFRALQALQRSHYVPRFRDSLQELPDYPGEIWFFTVFDPDAPTIKDRGRDDAWTLEQRLEFAREAILALKEVHGLTDEQQIAIVHRKLSPTALLVGGRNRPVITDFNSARLPLTQTITKGAAVGPADEWVAKEVREGGLAAATAASDVFSLCYLLSRLFADHAEPEATKFLAILAEGCRESPGERASLNMLLQKMEALVGGGSGTTEHLAAPAAEEIPPCEFWCEETEITMSGRTLRVLARLGSGGIGSAFKVEECDPETGEPYGTFVAKVIHKAEAGDRARRAYLRVRSYAHHVGLAAVHEVAEKWEANRVLALLRWLEGESLHGIKGCVGLAVEECGEPSLEALLRRWVQEACEALNMLHSNGRVHCDVSPKNLIYHVSGLRLTDFDLVTRTGEKCWGGGAKGYSSPEAERGEPVSPADDIFALAASLFETVFDRSAFQHPDGGVDKQRGLSWLGAAERAEVGSLAEFFDRATASRLSDRFSDASVVLAWLQSPAGGAATPVKAEVVAPEPGPSEFATKTDQIVPWLNLLLTVYPGSPYGNVETRGLDSDFAVATYVPTRLENDLIEEIRSQKTRLVVLCGNAGDGKTALLQRLASAFGVDRHKSEQRIWEAKTKEGLTLKANLDGAAAWQDRSADELLDELLLPFLERPPDDGRVHLLAINDGRLLKWVDEKRDGGVGGALVAALTTFLDHEDDASSIPAHFRFLNLNHRSLVGGQEGIKPIVSATFLNDLITALLGGTDAAAKWAPCLSCSAWDRCAAGPTAHRLLAESDTEEGKRGERLRQRLAEALQAVHQRGNVHVTARELRGTLSYMLFGVRFCSELHADPRLDANNPTDRHRIGDLAFDPDSPHRQGDLLRELSRLDPALEAHPHLDRWLLGGSAREVHGAGRAYPGLSLGSARRRAYFEWLPDEIAAVAGSENALGLASGQHLGLFRAASLQLPTENAELCERLCRGMSQLEDLPAVAHQRVGMVPLRIPPRTPTESKFWTEQPLSRFRLEPELPLVRDAALTLLPCRLRLVFQRADGLSETLAMGYELFHTLLRLAEGEQLSEQRSDDLFANLQIFTQRIAQEENRSLLAWSPKEDATVFRLALQPREGGQALALAPAEAATP